MEWLIASIRLLFHVTSSSCIQVSLLLHIKRYASHLASAYCTGACCVLFVVVRLVVVVVVVVRAIVTFVVVGPAPPNEERVLCTRLPVRG